MSTREQIAITLALADDLVSPPQGGKYYRYADDILPLIEEAVTAERERCAQVAEDAWLDYAGESGSAYICDFVATAIRKEPND